MDEIKAAQSDETVELLKDYLGQYTRAKRRQRRLEGRLKEVRYELDHPIGGKGYKPFNKASRNTESKAANLTVQLSECELRIYDQREKTAKDLTKIMDILDYLDANSDERIALEMHYIDGYKWERVAEEIPCSRSQAYILREKGMQKLLEYKRVRNLLARYSKEQGL